MVLPSISSTTRSFQGFMMRRALRSTYPVLTFMSIMPWCFWSGSINLLRISSSVGVCSANKKGMFYRTRPYRP